ncbi:hypothetical protein ECMA6_5255, partial [Escherichia coli MA6]
LSPTNFEPRFGGVFCFLCISSPSLRNKRP